MKITIHNYEAFFLDSIEGRISKRDQQELDRFLEIHPELVSEIGEYAFVPLVPMEDEFADKSGLRKFDFEASLIKRSNFEDYCIAYHEGLLSESTAIALHAFINSSKDLRKTFQLYGKVTVKPYVSIRFLDKNALYRTPKISIIRPALLLAASVALLFAIYSVVHYSGKKSFEVQNTPYRSMVSVKRVEKNQLKDISNVIQTSVNKGYKKLYKDSTISTQNTISASLPDYCGIDKSVYEPILAINSETAYETIVLNCDDELLKPQTVPVFLKYEVLFASDDANRNRGFYEGLLTNVHKFRFARIPKLSLFGIVKSGVNEIASLTSLNVKMRTQTDSTGTVTAYCIDAGKYSYYSPVD